MAAGHLCGCFGDHNRLAFKLHIHWRIEGVTGKKSEKWPGSRPFGVKCSHSNAVRGHPDKSWLVEVKGASITKIST